MQFRVLTEQVSELTLGGTTGAVIRFDRVDWSHEVVLVADLGEQRTGGYSVRFRGIRVEDNAIEASVEVTRPGPGAMLIQILTRPYATTTVSRSLLSPGPISVRFTDATGAELGRVQASL